MPFLEFLPSDGQNQFVVLGETQPLSDLHASFL